MTAWIRMIADAEADADLTAHLDRARPPNGKVDNVMRVHSLRPHTMGGHVALYRSVLHHADNTLPLWFLELVGAYTSILNQCDYSLANHFANFRSLLNNEAHADAVHTALTAQQPEQVFDGKQLALLRYTKKLTLTPASMVHNDIEALRAAGADDGEILEVNQVCGYFNYVNRLLNGLGVTLAGDHIGYYR